MEKKYKKQLSKYVKRLDKNKFYSLKRLDVLLILISTSGIFLITNVLNSDFSPTGLRVGLALFALSIVCNILSQILSMESHSQMEKIYRNQIANESESSLDTKKEKFVRVLSYAIVGLNYASYILLIAGILISIFTYTSTS